GKGRAEPQHAAGQASGVIPRNLSRRRRALARYATIGRRRPHRPIDHEPRRLDHARRNSVKIYRAGDALPGALAGETVAVLGYGNLGRSAALNLRDSGVKVRIGNRDDEYADQARADGFEVVPLATAAGADIVFVLLPDEVIPEVFARDVAPELRPGSAVAFGSGYSVAFGLVHPPEALVMEMYMSGEMETVFAGFRTAGFLRASEDHGPTAIFGGITRAIEIDREELSVRFRRVLDDIRSGAFAERFQAEARAGYP